MKKIIFAALLSTTAVAPAFAANWVMVGQTEGMTVYADKSTAIRSEGKVRMWSLYDFKTIQTGDGVKPYLSDMLLYEHDCAERKSKLLQTTSRLGNMGNGELAESITMRDPKWSYAVPDSIGESVLIAACRKSKT